jgi:hypothetical protein
MWGVTKREAWHAVFHRQQKCTYVQKRGKMREQSGELQSSMNARGQHEDG